MFISSSSSQKQVVGPFFICLCGLSFHCGQITLVASFPTFLQDQSKIGLKSVNETEQILTKETIKSINQSINQSIIQSISQSVNQSTLGAATFSVTTYFIATMTYLVHPLLQKRLSTGVP